MGCSRNWKMVELFGDLGIISVKPKVGPGNGSSYGYVYHLRRVEPHAGYAKMEHLVAFNILSRLAAGVLKNERNRWLHQNFFGSRTQLVNCNTLYLWDARDNPNSRDRYYFFFTSLDDLAIFNFFLTETDPKLWNEEYGRRPYLGSFRT